jgi:methyl-accepting chemotaxis protein
MQAPPNQPITRFMSDTSRLAQLAAATRRLSPLTLLSGLRSLTAHHGMWGPGVRLLRNMDLRGKGALVFLCILLPLIAALSESVLARRATLGAIDAARTSLSRAQALSALQLATRGAMDAHLSGDPQQTTAALRQRALADEQMQFERLAGLLAPRSPDDATLASVFDHLARSRKTLLQALAGPRRDAVVVASGSYQRLQQDLRLEIERGWLTAFGVSSDDDRLNKSLRTAFAGHLPELVPILSGLAGRTEQLARGNRNPADIARTLHQLGEARLLLRLSGPSLEQVRSAKLMDATRLDEQLRQVNALLQRTETLALQQLRVHEAEPAAPSAAAGEVLALTVIQEGGRAVSAVNDLVAAGTDALARRLDDIDSRMRARTLFDSSLLLACLLLCGYFLVCAYKVVAGGLKTLCAQVDELGRGNLSIRPHGRGKDEVGVALTTLGRAAERMSSLFEAVTQGVSAVSHASREVANGNAGLSNRTGSVRDAIGHVAERAQSFSAAMDGCAREVEAAAEHVRTMGADAQRSRKAMLALRERMRALQGKSREIGRVVEMMESVAYQTKLLSLNASVEAARAGPAGKGFAVVAAEVRALAQRSEDAARNIHEIISGSISEIEEGGLMTDRASEAVRRTDELIQTVNRIMGDIVRLTRDGMSQSQEVLDITRQVEENVSGNARLVDQLSQASGDLRSQGDNLKRSVQHFVLG